MKREKKVAVKRLPAVPLITCDPYFSVWSAGDRLYETDSVHWTGKRKRITGTARIDGNDYRFMGRGKAMPMEQTKLEVTAFFTQYCFEMAGVGLAVTFWTPLLLSGLDELSRPCSYLDMAVCSLDGKKHQVEISWEFAGELCCNQGQTEKSGAAWAGNSGGSMARASGAKALGAQRRQHCYRLGVSLSCIGRKSGQGGILLPGETLPLCKLSVFPGWRYA